MRPIELLAAAAVAATAVASFSFFVGGPGAAPSAPSRVTGAAGAGPGSTGTAPKPTRTAASAAPTLAASTVPSADATVRARVVIPGGSPAAGVAWRISGWPRGDWATGQPGVPEGWEGPSGVTGAEGLLDLTFEAPPAHRFEIEFELDGYARAAHALHRLRRGRDLDLGTVQLRPESILFVRVVDESGHPVIDPALRVAARRRSGFASAFGAWRTILASASPGTNECELRGLAAGRYEVDVQPSGRAEPGSFTAYLSVGAAHQREVVCAPVAAAEPPAATVLLTPRWPALAGSGVDPAHVTATDATGGAAEVLGGGHAATVLRVEEPFAPPLTFRVRDPRFEPVDVEDLGPGDRVRERVVGTSSVRLRVSDETGAAVETYSVQVESAQQGPSSRRVLHGGGCALQDGVVRGLYSGAPLRFFVATPTHRGVATLEDAVAGTTTDLDVTLSAVMAARGQVLRPDGTPAPFVDVVLARRAEIDDSDASPLLALGAGTSDRQRFRVAVAMAEADAEGRFSLVAPGPGDYVVLATNGGAGVERWSEPFPLAEESAEVSVELPRGATLIGELDLPGWLDPNEVFVYPSVGRLARKDARVLATRVDAEGRFRMTGLPAGEVEVGLFVRRSSFGANSLRPVCAVELEEGSVRQVTCDVSNSMVGAVRLHPASGDRFPDDWRLLMAYTSQDGDGDRSSRLDGPAGASTLGPVVLEPGAWLLRAQGEDWADLAGVRLNLPPGQLVDVQLDAAPDLERRTIAIERDGSPVRGERIWFERADAHSWMESAEFTTDQEGRLDVALDAGELKVYSTHSPGPGEAPGAATLTWPPENGAVIELE